MIDNYITGANGFIGARLRKTLCAQGQRTVCIPHQDIQSSLLQSCGRFFFLSSYGNMASQLDWDETMKANVADLLAMAGQWTESSKPGALPDHVLTNAATSVFVHVSSSSVRLPVLTPYARAKRAAEEILRSLIEARAPVCIVRPFSVTGMGEQAEHLIPRLIRSCLYREVMPFVAQPAHDFIDIEDVVDGMIAAANIVQSSKSKVQNMARGGVYELGNGRSITNAEVLAIVEEVTGKKAQIISSDGRMRSYDTQQWEATLPAGWGGWKPKKSLRQSIEEMVCAERREEVISNQSVN